MSSKSITRKNPQKNNSSFLSKVLTLILAIVIVVSFVLFVANIVADFYYSKLVANTNGLVEGKFDVFQEVTINNKFEETSIYSAKPEDLVLKITKDEQGANVYNQIKFSEVENVVKANYDEKSKEENLKSDKNVFNYILIGNDGFGSDKNNSRADVIVIISYDSEGKIMSEVMLEANSFVYIPQVDKVAPLADAYTLGGGLLLSRTIQENFGISINGYFNMDIETAASSVDEIGSVTMWLDNNALNKLNENIDLLSKELGKKIAHAKRNEKGAVELNGSQVAAYLKGSTGSERTAAVKTVLSQTLDQSIKQGASEVKDFVDVLAEKIDMCMSREDFGALTSVSLLELSKTDINFKSVNSYLATIGIDGTWTTLSNNKTISEKLIKELYK